MSWFTGTYRKLRSPVIPLINASISSLVVAALNLAINWAEPALFKARSRRVMTSLNDKAVSKVTSLAVNGVIDFFIPRARRQGVDTVQIRNRYSRKSPWNLLNMSGLDGDYLNAL